MKLIKKLFILLLFLTACSKEEVEINFDVKIESQAVDMSAYKGVSSTKHKFEEVNLYDVYDFIDAGGSAVFYLGYVDCSSCQQAIQYLNEVAQELDVTVYYINIDKDEYGIRSDVYAYNEVLEKLDPILYHEDGETKILTPDIFQVINGEFADNHIGLTSTFDSTSQESIDELKEIYYELLLPFSSKQ